MKKFNQERIFLNQLFLKKKSVNSIKRVILKILKMNFLKS